MEDGKRILWVKVEPPCNLVSGSWLPWAAGWVITNRIPSHCIHPAAVANVKTAFPLRPLGLALELD